MSTRPTPEAALTEFEATTAGVGDARDRARRAERQLRLALRDWAQRHMGSVDALAEAVADRLDVSLQHARDGLYRDGRGRVVLREAVAIWRERTGATSPTPGTVLAGGNGRAGGAEATP